MVKEHIEALQRLFDQTKDERWHDEHSKACILTGISMSISRLEHLFDRNLGDANGNAEGANNRPE